MAGYVGAPYNFIPFEEKTYAPIKMEEMGIHDRLDKDLLSGEITYTIEAKTPIMIDNGKGMFFKNEHEQYAIPGSTIRGLLRNNVQILSASSFDRDIDDYNLMYRHVASGVLKKEYNTILGNKPIKYGSGTLSILENVKAGEMTCVNGNYSISPTKVKHVESNLPNYYVLSERTIVGDYSKNKDKSAYAFFWNNGDILQNKHDKPFRKEVKNGRIHYIGENNPKYKPYFMRCSYKASGKNITAVSTEDTYTDKGYVLSSGRMNEKKAIYIIPAIDETAPGINISPSDIKAYKIDYKKKENTLRPLFGKDKKTAACEAEKFFGLPKEGEKKPVFYIELEGRLYFGFTPRLRLFYTHTIKEGYKQNQPEKGSFDLATSLFGLADDDLGSYKSKISVCDALLNNAKKPEGESKVVLAEPKPTSYLDYIVQTNDPVTYSSEDFRLRGVKQYWIRDKIDLGRQNSNNTEIGSVINPLPAGSEFKGIIRFDNLTRTELGLLLWALRLEKDSCMNIGKGKPYGYGVIKVSGIEAKTLNIDKAYGFDSIAFDPFVPVDVDSIINEYKTTEVFGYKIDELESVKSFFAMKNWEKKPNPEYIRYMSIDDREYQSRIKDSIPLMNIQEVLSGKTQENKAITSNQNKDNKTPGTTVTISRVEQDKKDPHLCVGFVNPKGMIFNIPKGEVKPGDKVRVKITNAEKQMGNYLGKV